MGNAIPTTTDNVDDGANLPESPEPSPRTVASFESIRRMAQLEVMNEIEKIIQGVDTKKDINVSNIRTAVEEAVEEIVKRWGGNFDYDAKDLLRFIHDRINRNKIKQFTTPELTNDEVNVIKTNMMDIAEDISKARAAAIVRDRAIKIASGWTVNPDNPDGPLDSPRGGGSKKKRRTGKKLKAKQHTTTRALLKKWKKNEIKENNKKIRK